jgi:sulfite reductase beta subunit-like hemoprotein
MAALGEERRLSYFLFLGGRIEGGLRLGEVARKGITEEMVVPTLDALLEVVLAERRAGERFGDVVARVGPAAIGRELETRLSACRPQEARRVALEPSLVEAER